MTYQQLLIKWSHCYDSKLGIVFDIDLYGSASEDRLYDYLRDIEMVEAYEGKSMWELTSP